MVTGKFGAAGCYASAMHGALAIAYFRGFLAVIFSPGCIEEELGRIWSHPKQMVMVENDATIGKAAWAQKPTA